MQNSGIPTASSHPAILRWRSDVSRVAKPSTWWRRRRPLRSRSGSQTLRD